MSAANLFSWLAALSLALALDYLVFRWFRQHWAQGDLEAILTARLAWLLAPLQRVKQWWAQVRPVWPSASFAHRAAELSPSSTVFAPSATEVEATSVPNTPDLPLDPPAVEPSSAASLRPIHINIVVNAPEGSAVRLTIETLPGEGVTVVQQPALEGLTPPTVSVAASPRLASTHVWRPAGLLSLWAKLRAQWAARAVPLATVLFGLALGIYILTRLIGLEQFPVYFFTDEAVHTNMAADFIQRGLRNYENDFLPVYFNLGLWLNGVSVYVQVLPYLLFGKSMFVTRAASALVTACGAAAIGLTLKHVFKVRYWWAGVLLLSIAPTWFFHSRTAFEYVELASFYAIFIYCYLRYVTDAPRYLYGAVVAGALVFYTHGLGQMLMGVTSVLLLLVDGRYHWRQRPIVLRALALAVVLSLPFFRYILAHPTTYFVNLRQRDSYWTNLNFTLADKLLHFASEYVYGLSPQFWFFPNDRDLIRHVMKGYGSLLAPTLPLILLGLGYVLRHIRSAAPRTLLLTLLSTPVGSALVAIGIPRMLPFVIPATLLTALGLALVLEWLEQWATAQRWRLSHLTLSLSIFVVLAGFNGFMLWDALVNGPLWFRDYTLYGLQYGAKQVFGELTPALLTRDPNARVFISPSWANGTDQLLTFFVKPDLLPRAQMGTVDDYLANRRPLDATMFFVMMPQEYERAATSPKFKSVTVEQILPYPDGLPGFYLGQLAYADNVDAIFTAEREERQKPVVETLVVHGETLTVAHSLFDGGSLKDIFDGDAFTLARGQEANPLIIEITFPTPRTVSTLRLTVGSMDNFTVNVAAFAPNADQPVTYSNNFVSLPADPQVDIPLAQGPAPVIRLRLEIKNNLAGFPTNIHVREIAFQE